MLHLEREPEHAAIKFDNENHLNESMRHAELQFCASRPKLAPIIPERHSGSSRYPASPRVSPLWSSEDRITFSQIQVNTRMLTRIYQSRLSPLSVEDLIVIRWRIIVHPQTAGQSTHVRAGAAAIHLSAHLSCVVSSEGTSFIVVRFAGVIRSSQLTPSV